MTVTPAIETHGLNVWFGKHRDRVDAVVEANFTIARGESYGIVGESGSGKSTVLRAIMGLVPNVSGAIAIEGTPVAKPRSKAFYGTVQMVFQDPYASLHPRHSVDQVLNETLALHGFKDRDARVLKLMDDCGLARNFRFRYPHQLSGGQRQRVAIARALAPEPDILLLDEPTSALDVSVQAEILNLLVDLRAEHGLTYVMVSHDLAVIAHICARTAVMQAGRVVEELPVAALRRLEASHSYTKHLLESATGFSR